MQAISLPQVTEVRFKQTHKWQSLLPGKLVSWVSCQKWSQLSTSCLSSGAHSSQSNKLQLLTFPLKERTMYGLEGTMMWGSLNLKIGRFLLGNSPKTFRQYKPVVHYRPQPAQNHPCSWGQTQENQSSFPQGFSCLSPNLLLQLFLNTGNMQSEIQDCLTAAHHGSSYLCPCVCMNMRCMHMWQHVSTMHRW